MFKCRHVRKRGIILMAAILSLTTAAAAETVADPQEQCPQLIDQVETRLQTSPPQDSQSVQQAQTLLEEARAAREAGDFKTCMSKIRKAFKSLNKT